ncbi:MAG: hypothetical protein E7183_00955 [Erysipelotrichaceae bacterium]|nr:hypothetical protein [Erysipelotrichaceae bacterium]
MDNRVLFGVMCIIFNSIGVPCFMQGEIKKGILRIVLGIITFGIIEIINFVKGIILGVQVLKMTDEEYAEKKYTLSSGIPA